ncbi:sigma-70 family RNA polymerase sigma factor [Chitinophaga ginsengisegetis]|uniref:RNA polymerase sigma factor n=1 Tax=Chitinophaga ginsengisegetis TaxID=393003 RepID=UPI000DBA06AB|nr:sigma-70 family RNA polymerase sigma factor [Chitinophaga ginsengisegetis]MDR6568254.1 RNA polymerase sigma-70 factor (ECF subfamily) [Chitinophaga ginsengisegetis]MDR6648515.1 RNA polymerase sigma-70 factor (ECF subfamily) [Chitinophaga ginsengisegetis]MDR6654335.1 RNA polymerase sigma-70 factor (ECF subfamily) [Chitinophaga ginsengisegetis]
MDTQSLHLEERFKRIYLENKDRLYHFVKRYTKDPLIVEDLVQECFIKVWDNLLSLKDDAMIYPLLRTYVYRIVVNHNQKEARRLLRDAAFNEKQPLSVSFEEDLLFKDGWRSFHEVINTLPEKRRKIFLLKQQHGYTHQEIADQLKVSVKAIEKHLSLANQVLREKFVADKLVVVLILLSMQAEFM